MLGFPSIFRGALDVRAREIDEPMKVAAARALADLARQELPKSVAEAYGARSFRFGPEYIIPKPFDSRAATCSTALKWSRRARRPNSIADRGPRIG